MNVLKELQKAVVRCKYVLAYDRENAKEFKEKYRVQVEFLNQVNEKYFEEKTEELQAWCNASVVAFNIPQKGLKKLERKIKMNITNNHISRLCKEIYLSAEVKAELEEIKIQFDRLIYLTG